MPRAAGHPRDLECRGTGLEELKEYLWKFVERPRTRMRSASAPMSRIYPATGSSWTTNRWTTTLAYLALTQVPGLGHARLQTLFPVSHPDSAPIRRRLSFYAPFPGFPAPSLRPSRPRRSRPAGRDRETERVGARVIIPADDGFPALLLIPDPPPVLFALGNLALLDRPAVAVVGSRDHTNTAPRCAGPSRGGRLQRAWSW